MSPQLRHDRIRERMEARRLTAGQVAYLSGVSTAHIYRVLAGERPNASGQTLAQIADALETTTDYLLGLTDDPYPSEAARQLTDLEHEIMRLFRLLPERLQRLAIGQLDLWLDHRDSWGIHPEDDDTREGDG